MNRQFGKNIRRSKSRRRVSRRISRKPRMQRKSKRHSKSRRRVSRRISRKPRKHSNRIVRRSKYRRRSSRKPKRVSRKLTNVSIKNNRSRNSTRHKTRRMSRKYRKINKKNNDMENINYIKTKFDPDKERIAITCGDAGENHAGMEMLGKLGKEGTGFTIKDLFNIKKSVEKLKIKCDYYDLSNNEARVINNINGKYVKTDKIKEAGVLVLRNFLNKETVNNVYNDITSVEWDTKYYDTRRGVVLNKLARSNIVFLKGVEQKPDYENKKGTIVDWTKLKHFNNVLENVFSLINNVTDCKANGLIAEGNWYKKNKLINGKNKNINNGIGWHGDSERRKVICICIGGVDYCMKWQWFYKHRPLNNNPFEVFVNSGDIYIMSEEAVGQKWKSSSIYTLRHSAGPDRNSPYVQYKKEWIEYLKNKEK